MQLSNCLIFKGLLFLVCISGCIKKNNLKLDDKYQQKEARLFDVPLPLNYITLDNRYGQDSYGFKTTVKDSELVDFYKEEMVNAGWKIISSFSDIETNLLFEKPHKFILISIRPNIVRNNTEVHIFVAIKKEDS
ncbi:MAG: hypothetical protein P4L22_07290 [Candidatus Babeliales bacterium]|nr:hypothetical protein [Candidatus Babeliales bacterium]